MRTFLIGATALASAMVAAPAMAEDAPAATPEFTFNGGATLVSDYRFRGISQTDRNFAVQGTMTVTHKSGIYLSVWGSSIDDYVANGSDQEIDLIAGYSHNFGKVKLDGGVLYYYYPGAGKHYNSDFVEPYLSASGTIGPVGIKVGGTYAPKAKALAVLGHKSDDNTYLYGELSFAIPKTGLTLTSHIGHSFGRDLLTLGAKGYTDYNIGATYTWKALTLGVSYVDTSFGKRSGPFPGLGNIGATNNHSLYHEVKGGVVGSVGVAF